MGQGLNLLQRLKENRDNMNPGERPGVFKQLGGAYVDMLNAQYGTDLGNRASNKRFQSLMEQQTATEYSRVQQQGRERQETQAANALAAKGLGQAFKAQNEGQRMGPGEAMAAGDVLQGLGPQAAGAFTQDPFINPAVAAQMREQEMEAQESQTGRWGSGITYAQFAPLRDKAMSLQQSIDNTQFIMDVIGQTTPAQLATRGMASTRGRLKTAVFGMYKTVQGLSESKDSTLRDAERKAIDSFLGGPGQFWAGIASHDAATIEKMQLIQEAVNTNMRVLQVGLDERTVGLLNDAARPNPNMHNWTLPEGAVIRDAVGAQATPLEAQQTKREEAGGFPGVVSGLKDIYSGYRGDDWSPE